MKRYELMQDKDKRREVAMEICSMIFERVECHECPFDNRCKYMYNGAMAYFEEEVRE